MCRVRWRNQFKVATARERTCDARAAVIRRARRSSGFVQRRRHSPPFSGMEYALALHAPRSPTSNRARALNRYLYSRRRARCDEVAWVIRELNSRTILEET